MKKLPLLLFLSILFIGCEKEDIILNPLPNNNVETFTNISDSVDLYGDASKGLDLYLGYNSLGIDPNGRACVNCHLSPTGVDLVRFGKNIQQLQDSIIVQRATFNESTGHGHISKEDAYHIAAYIRQLTDETNIQPNNNGDVMVKPQGPIASNVWDGSTSLTVSQIDGWDFKNNIHMPFDFPKWFAGDETNTMYNDNTDFLPEIDLVTEKGGQIASKFDVYIANPNKNTLKDLMYTTHHTLTEGERNPGEHGYNNFEKSFDYQRWLATLYLQHILDPNSDLEYGEEIDGYDVSEFSMLDPIWDVGNVARRSQDNGSLTGNGNEIDNRLLNEVQWLYMGWIGNYGKRNSFESQYIGTALKDYGEQDLASLVVLKCLVNRSDNSQRMYDDIFTMGYITSDDMFYESVIFGLDYLINGINSGNNHFTLNNQSSIDISMGYLKNDSSSDPDLKQFVESKTFLTQSEKDLIIGKIDTLYSLLDNM